MPNDEVPVGEVVQLEFLQKLGRVVTLKHHCRHQEEIERHGSPAFLPGRRRSGRFGSTRKYPKARMFKKAKVKIGFWQ